MRHSYATAGLKAGVPAKVMSERLGHATVAFTLDTYAHVLPGMDADAADLVANMILGEPLPQPAGEDQSVDKSADIPVSGPEGERR